jgi:hypothetical protein
MPIIAIASLAKAAAKRVADACGLPLLHEEVVARLAERMALPGSRVERLLEGSAGLIERLCSDRASLSIHCADAVLCFALQGKTGVMPAWGVSRLLRDAPHVGCIDAAGMGLAHCIERAAVLLKSGAFAETRESRRRLEDIALAWRVRAALRVAAPTRGLRVAVSAEHGRVRLEGIVLSAEQRAAAAGVAAGVAGVRRLEDLLRAADALRPRFT